MTNTFPYFACGGQQDNSTVCVPVQVPRGDLGPGYFSAGGGESGYVTPHPTKTNLFYSGSQGALITRFDRATGHIRDIQPYPRFFSGEPARDLPERWQWTFPIVFDPFDANTLYISSQHVWKTTDDGQTWTRISPDLTRADPKTLGDSGGPITHDMNGPEIFATVFALGPSTRRARPDLDRIGRRAGAGDARRRHDLGERHAARASASSHAVSTVEPSPHKSKAGTAYVAGKRYLLPPGDRQPYLFRTDDYGKTWTKIVNGIAPNHYTHSIREDPKRPGLLFAGTEHGVYVSFDDGAQLAVAAAEHARHADLGSRGEGRRSRGRHARPIVLGARQHHDAAPAGAGGDRGLSEGVRASRGDSGPHDRADVDYYLANDADKVTRGDPRCPRGRSSARSRERLKTTSAPRRPAAGGRWRVRRAATASAVDEGRAESLLVEPPLSGRHGLRRHDHLERQPRAGPASPYPETIRCA